MFVAPSAPQRPAAAKPVSSVAGYPAGFGAAGMSLAGVPGIAGQVGSLPPGSMAAPPASAPAGPTGPKLSDYWKPKAGRTGSGKAQPQVSQVPQGPPSQPHVYPGVTIPGSTAMTMPGQVPGAYPQQGVPTSAGHLPPGSVAGGHPSQSVASAPRAPHISMAQPGFPGAAGQQQYAIPRNQVPGQGMHPQHGVPPSSQRPPQIPQQAPLVRPPNVSQGPSQSPVHQNQAPQHPVPLSSGSSQNAMHVPQQVPGGSHVPPGAVVAPSMHAPPPQSVPNASVANNIYHQQPLHQNQMVPSSGVGQPSQGQHMVPHSSAHQPQLPPSSGQAAQGSLPSQPQGTPGIPHAATVTQPPMQPPPAYGSQQHHIAKAASMATPTAPPQSNVPPGNPASSYSNAHLSTSTNTTASHMPGNAQNQANANSTQSVPGQPPVHSQIVPTPAGQTQMNNVQMPSQLGNPQHQPVASQVQPHGNWQQQQHIQQQQLHQQQMQQQQIYQQQQHQQPQQMQPGAPVAAVMPNTSMSQQKYPGMQPQTSIGNVQQQPGVQQISQQPQPISHQQQPGIPSQQQNQQVPTSHQQKQMPPQQNLTAQNYSSVAQPSGQLPASQPQPLQNVPQQQQQHPQMKPLPTQQVFPQVQQQQQMHQQPQQPAYQVPSSQPQSAQKPPGQQVFPQQGLNQVPPQQQVQPQMKYPQGVQQTPGGAPYQSTSSPSKQQVPLAQPQGQTQMQGGVSHVTGILKRLSRHLEVHPTRQTAGTIPPQQQVQPQMQYPQAPQQTPGGAPYQNTSSPSKQQVPLAQPQGQTQMQGGVSHVAGGTIPPQQQVQPQMQYPQGLQQTTGGAPYQSTSSPSKQQVPPAQPQGQTQMQGGVSHVTGGTIPPQQQVQPQMQYPQGPQPTPGGAPYQNTSSPSKQQVPPAQPQGQLQGGVNVAGGTGSYQSTGHVQQQGVVRPAINQPYQQPQQPPQQQQQFIPQQQIQPQIQQQNQPRQQTPIQSGVQPPQNQQYSQQQQQQHQSPQRLPQTHPGAANPGYAAQPNMKPPFQATPQQQLQQPLQPMNPVQQLKQQQNFEQRRLPQPVLQPMKASAKPATDLLSTSPDREKQPLKDVLAPQNVPATSGAAPQATQPVVDPNSNVSVLASIDVQPTNTSQSLSQISNIVITPSATPATAATSSTTDILAALKLQPTLSVPPPATPVPPKTGLQQLPSGASPQLNSNLATSQPQAATPPTLSTTGKPKPDDNDPYADKESLEKFVEEVERLDKYVEGLYRKMLSGPTVIERLWKV